VIELIEIWQDYGDLFRVDMERYTPQDRYLMWMQLYAQMMGWA
jgi:hypothetical protein